MDILVIEKLLHYSHKQGIDVKKRCLSLQNHIAQQLQQPPRERDSFYTIKLIISFLRLNEIYPHQLNPEQNKILKTALLTLEPHQLLSKKPIGELGDMSLCQCIAKLGFFDDTEFLTACITNINDKYCQDNWLLAPEEFGPMDASLFIAYKYLEVIRSQLDTEKDFTDYQQVYKNTLASLYNAIKTAPNTPDICTSTQQRLELIVTCINNPIFTQYNPLLQQITAFFTQAMIAAAGHALLEKYATINLQAWKVGLTQLPLTPEALLTIQNALIASSEPCASELLPFIKLPSITPSVCAGGGGGEQKKQPSSRTPFF